MSVELAAVLAGEFGLTRQERAFLVKTRRSLDRLERRHYFQFLRPREKVFKTYLTRQYNRLPVEEQQKWLDLTLDSMLAKGGEPDLVDCLVMNVIGPLRVFHHLRRRSEERGIRLKVMTSFGGLSMVLYLVVIITAVVLYFIARY
ncbi:MAG: hypothetical protein C4589_07175 [Peptococcaceae bacterium]|nr:MAG: hypothetical protein C4589_07175 [Peptococcaceae bacterium]